MKFNIFKCINITVFLLSFFLGLLFVYFFEDKKKIYVYPTPHNLNNIQFRDKADNCFKYDIEKTTCPKDKNLISNIPIQ